VNIHNEILKDRKVIFYCRGLFILRKELREEKQKPSEEGFYRDITA